MKYTVEVIINEGGLTCTTTNPLGEKPMILKDSENSVGPEEYKAWHQAEADRITYEIHSVTCQGVEYTENRCEDGIILQPGTKHLARIENGKAVII